MKLAYIDSCVWITRVEGLPGYRETIDQDLQSLAQAGWTFCTSDVVVFEVLIKPLKDDQKDLVQIYRNIIDKLKLLKNYSAVFKNALQLAKSENLKGMDAIHIAFAEHYNCGCFVTCDPHFRNLGVVTPILIDLSKRISQ